MTQTTVDRPTIELLITFPSSLTPPPYIGGFRDDGGIRKYTDWLFRKPVSRSSHIREHKKVRSQTSIEGSVWTPLKARSDPMTHPQRQLFLCLPLNIYTRQ